MQGVSPIIGFSRLLAFAYFWGNRYEEDKYGLSNLTTGEVVHELTDDEEFTIKTKKEKRRDKFYSPQVKINQGQEFIKCMLDKLELLVKEFNKKSGAFLALNVMLLHLDSADNCVKDEKKGRYKLKDLATEMKISRQQATNYVKQLKALNVVQEIEMYDGYFYAVNPDYYCRSAEIPERVLKAFDMGLRWGITMIAYIVLYENLKTDMSISISQEAYNTFDKAVKFIESRNGNPKRNGERWDWHTEDNQQHYSINEIRIV